MPVVGNDLRGRGQRNAGTVEFANQNVKQRADSTEEMHAMGGSENGAETAGEGHEEHQNGNNTESDAGVVAIRRGRTGAAALVVVPTAWGRGGAASSSSDVVHYEFDVRKCGCARHGDLPYSTDSRALAPCSGARCCGRKSSATSGTLNS